MPELPEVQTVVNYLQPSISRENIQSLESPNRYYAVLENGSPLDYNNFLIGKKIKSVSRRGKYIILNLNSGYLLIHLRMTGKVLLEKPDPENMKYVSFQLNFSDDSSLFFHDVRKFGRIYMSKKLDRLENKLGVEPLSNEFTPNWLYKHLKYHKRMIKPLLLDQKFIAGLGNIYIDESLWESCIHPRTQSNNISQNRSNQLSCSIINILRKAISYNGTTIINYSYGKNNNGNFSDKLHVFGKTNFPCPRCNTLIVKNFVAQRGTHFCKKCQKY